MKLLGVYPSSLYAHHRQELLKLLEQALAAGDFGGGRLVNTGMSDVLARQSQDFSSLPAIQAGSRADAQSLLYTLQLLTARYAAISQERSEFLSRIERFLSVLEKDTGLVDQLLAAARMETWVSRRGTLSGAYQFYQDFAATHGSCAVDLPLTDPATGVLYQAPVQDVSFILNAVAGLESQPLRAGIGVPAAYTKIRPINVSWSYTSDGEVEDLVSDDWAKLSLLEDAPRLTYGAPVTEVLIPSGASVEEVVRVSGRNSAGNLPVFVRLLFAPRRISRQLITEDAGVEIPITSYELLGDDFVVLDGSRSYERGMDYTVDAAGRFVSTSVTANKTLTLNYSEMYPAYQCSVNQQDWGPVLLFDANNPYPASATMAEIVSIQDNRFPVLDEQSRPLGMYLELLKTPATNYLFRVNTPVGPTYGVEAVLALELDKPSYINGFHLAPYASFPIRLKSVTAEGLTTDTGRLLFDGDVVLDRAVSLRFDRQLVRKVYLRFYQENYTYKEHLIDPADRLRRQTLVSLQAALPRAAQRAHISLPRRVEGVQYEFGVRGLYAEDWLSVMPQDYGIFIAGPFEVPGTPELIRLDAEFCARSAEDVRFYLIDTPFDAQGLQAASAFHVTDPHGVRVTPGVAFSYTPPSTLPELSKCRFAVKCVLRDPYAVVERFVLGATHV